MGTLTTYLLTCPGREKITVPVRRQIERQNPGEAVRVFNGLGIGGKRDYWRLLFFAGLWGTNVLILEDDVITAKNFIRYVKGWNSPHMTSFFFLNGPGLTTYEPQSPNSFGYTQALWFPWRLAARLSQTACPERPRLQDDALVEVLSGWGEKVVYHRSLVQHVGNVSLCQPGAKPQQAPDFVGEDYDCMERHGQTK